MWKMRLNATVLILAASAAVALAQDMDKRSKEEQRPIACAPPAILSCRRAPLGPKFG